MPALPSHPPTRCGSRLFRKGDSYDYDTRSCSESLRTQLGWIGRGLVSTWFDASISNQPGPHSYWLKCHSSSAPLKEGYSNDGHRSVPTELHSWARATLEFPAALINGGMEPGQCQVRVVRKHKMGTCHQSGDGWLDDTRQFPCVWNQPCRRFCCLHQPPTRFSAPQLRYRPLLEFEAANVATPAGLTTAVISTPTDPGVDCPDRRYRGIGDCHLHQRAALDLWDQLVDRFVGFRTSYFPNENTLYATAETWLQDCVG